ncbi:hypothetical protein DFJ73DRAFT_957114 [Zopfochytrium polystomum]|nr:hypothetical protein DFJ73DRAFT_957114 [Zopfochytrium polystomum]
MPVEAANLAEYVAGLESQLAQLREIVLGTPARSPPPQQQQQQAVPAPAARAAEPDAKIAKISENDSNNDDDDGVPAAPDADKELLSKLKTENAKLKYRIGILLRTVAEKQAEIDKKEVKAAKGKNRARQTDTTTSPFLTPSPERRQQQQQHTRILREGEELERAAGREVEREESEKQRRSVPRQPKLFHHHLLFEAAAMGASADLESGGYRLPTGRIGDAGSGASAPSSSSASAAAAAGGQAPAAPDAANQNMFQQSKHPTVLFFHLFFRVAALLVYLFGWIFTSSFILTFVVIVLLLSFDFWTVKNVTGRLLVGLRWWSEIKEDGSEVWIFESKENRVQNPVDYRVFWFSLYATPAVWIVFGLGALIKLSFSWLLCVAVALAFNITNLIGYTKCEKDARAKLTNYIANQSFVQGMVGNFITNRIGSFFGGGSAPAGGAPAGGAGAGRV